MTCLLLLASLLLMALPPAATGDGPWVINEVDADQAGVDGSEFVELWGEPGASLQGLRLVLYNGSAAGDPAYRVVELGGTMPSSGLLVVGAAGVADVDVVAWSSNGLQNGPDAVALVHAPGLLAADLLGTAAGALPAGATRLDAVVYGVGSHVDEPLLKALTPGQPQQDEDLAGLSAQHSLQRLPDGGPGSDLFVLPPSPGAPNGVPDMLTIPEIQGAGHRSPYEGHRVSGVHGVVTRCYSGGFAMQVSHRLGDGDLSTSDGLWVATAGPPAVHPGDPVRVTGTVVERPAGGLTVTELVAVGVEAQPDAPDMVLPVRIGAGGRVPPTQVIDDDTTGDVNLGPTTFDPQDDGLDFYESLEGMLLQLDGCRVIAPPDFAGLLPVVVQGGRLATNLGERGVLAWSVGDQNPERQFLALSQADAWQVGDTVEGAVHGVLDYFQQRYVVRVQGEVMRRPLPLPWDAAPPAAPGRTRIASFNLRNLSPLVSDADVAGLASRIVADLGAPELLAVQEVQDDSGPANDGTTGASATYARLLAAIAEAGGPAYRAVEIAPQDGQDGGQPGGNIRVALLDREGGALDLVERPGGDATTAATVLPGPRGPELSVSPGRIEPSHPAFAQSRKPLVAEFRSGDEVLFVIAVHLVSKGGDGPDFGALQPPPAPSGAKRSLQAQLVADFAARILALDPDAAIVVLGDFNAAHDSLALKPLWRVGLANPIAALPPQERYTHIYQGQGAALDHVWLSPTLVPDATLDLVHVDVEFAAAPSDHDPVLVDLAWPRNGPRPPERGDAEGRERDEMLDRPIYRSK